MTKLKLGRILHRLFWTLIILAAYVAHEHLSFTIHIQLWALLLFLTLVLCAVLVLFFSVLDPPGPEDLQNPLSYEEEEHHES